MCPSVDMKYARSYINCTFNQQNSKLYFKVDLVYAYVLRSAFHLNLENSDMF